MKKRELLIDFVLLMATAFVIFATAKTLLTTYSLPVSWICYVLLVLWYIYPQHRYFLVSYSFYNDNILTFGTATFKCKSEPNLHLLSEDINIPFDNLHISNITEISKQVYNQFQ